MSSDDGAGFILVIIVVFLVIWCCNADKRKKNEQNNNESGLKRKLSYHPEAIKKPMENEDWITYDSSTKLIEDFYDDQVEGAADTSEQQHQLRQIWNSGQWSGHYQHDNGVTTKIQPFTLNFVFETDTVVGYGQEDVGEYLISGYFNPYSNRYLFHSVFCVSYKLHYLFRFCFVCDDKYRLAFRQEFMITPGGDDYKVQYPIDFQLKWNKQDKLFMGNFYIESPHVQTSGIVVISRDIDINPVD